MTCAPLGTVVFWLTSSVRRLAGGRRWVLLVVATCLASGIPTAVAQARPTAHPTAIVSLGDSYIAGNAGRWLGNSDTFTSSRDGTDRAWVTDSVYDPSRVYLEGSAGSCFDSDVAEVRSAQIPVADKVNLACSGAGTADIYSPGGQADRLGALARRDRVRLVVLSVGGNDLGFEGLVLQCAFAYGLQSGPCNTAAQAQVNALFAGTMNGVGRALDRIRGVMSATGYKPHSYRLILQSYPSPLPRAAEIRYPESDVNARVTVGHCPFYDADLNWTRDSFIPQLAAGLRFVAASHRVEYLDLSNFLQGREVCSKNSQLATPSSPPNPKRSEWARFIDYPAYLGLPLPPLQGDVNESLHPNGYAQRALGRCLTLVWRLGDDRGDDPVLHQRPPGACAGAFER